MIGIVVPVHNESATLADCLFALRHAAIAPALAGEQVDIVAVLDTCTDDSASIAATCGITVLSADLRNVGRARALGAELMVARGARWLAFTDADSLVAPDWLVMQLSLEADLVCGCVEVQDWSEHSDAVRERYLSRYVHADGHHHIHGANLGIAVDTYRAAGGFPPLVSGEDVALVDASLAVGARVAWSVAPRVYTSARRRARAPGGFSDYLRMLGETTLVGGLSGLPGPLAAAP
ncbi:glycosyltransferase [Pigmentiphaga aceris]|uniref:Glycosyltransferase n=1 Tax=Pigmentiphaga aceris TaxID=1940612 RepID=A0A5C0AYN5_9BURK|nr:glycosyltransferase [Pigmentiphaga aceris]QEI07468.1 glycosyltransferase [Pigmentiphaga aceris]